MRFEETSTAVDQFILSAGADVVQAARAANTAARAVPGSGIPRSVDDFILLEPLAGLLEHNPSPNATPATPATGAATRLSRAEALEIASGLQAQGRLDIVENIYRTLLLAHPEDAEVIHLLGILLHQRDGSDLALELLHKSLALGGGRADWYNDLGNVLAARQQASAAAQAFIQALTLAPTNAVVWNNLGAMLQRAGHVADARRAYRQAIELNPEFIDALNNLARLLLDQGQPNEAAEYFCRAYVIGPLHDKPKNMLGIAYYKLGQIDKAAETYRQWLRAEPGNATARHLYAACSRTQVPERASDAYVETTFDEYAQNFDHKLRTQLSYRGPELIATVLAQVCRPQQRLQALDAGCGTGLCGPGILPYACHLAGVDLSAGMLEQARRRACYAELSKSEIGAYLAQHPECFDLVVMADTLIYFGQLENILALSQAALREEGLLVFTVEEALERPEAHLLNPSGRYSHGRDYVQATLASSGFEVLSLTPAILRVEFGRQIDGLTIAARKTVQAA